MAFPIETYKDKIFRREDKDKNWLRRGNDSSQRKHSTFAWGTLQTKQTGLEC